MQYSVTTASDDCSIEMVKLSSLSFCISVTFFVQVILKRFD